MMDCFNHICQFRQNETINYDNCECLMCRNRCDGTFAFSADGHTLSAYENAKTTNNSDKGKVIMTKDAYEMFELISGVYFGKQYYFEEDNRMIYSRLSHNYMTKDKALNEFLDEIQQYE